MVEPQERELESGSPAETVACFARARARACARRARSTQKDGSREAEVLFRVRV